LEQSILGKDFHLFRHRANLDEKHGLTHGRGLGEAQRNLWLLSMPICSEINEAMQILRKTKYQANDQHVEA
jgi:hypothetical protein